MTTTKTTRLTERNAWILAQNNPFEFFQRDDIDIIFAQNDELRKAASKSFVSRGTQIICNRMRLCWGEWAKSFILSRPTERFLVFQCEDYQHGFTKCLRDLGRMDECRFHELITPKDPHLFAYEINRRIDGMPLAQLFFESKDNSYAKEALVRSGEKIPSLEATLRVKAKSMGWEYEPSFLIQFGVHLEQHWPWSGLENKRNDRNSSSTKF